MPGRRRRLASFAAAVTVAGLAAMPQAAFADLLAPDSGGSSNSSSMRAIYVIVSIIAILVVVAVVLAILRAVARSRRGGAEPERRTEGTRGLHARAGLGLGAAALALFVVGVIFAESSRDVEASTSGAEPITIKATGQQWLWRYAYPVKDLPADGFSPDQPYSYYELVVPEDTPITLELSSIDVLHRWWVPGLARSADAVPGSTSEVSFTADQPGTYYGRSTEFSGAGYATMRTAVRVVSQSEYQSFLDQQLKGIKDARSAVQDRVDAGTAPGVEFEE